MIDVQALPTGLLVQTFREKLMAFARDTEDTALGRETDQLEEEILRRMAW